MAAMKNNRIFVPVFLLLAISASVLVYLCASGVLGQHMVIIVAVTVPLYYASVAIRLVLDRRRGKLRRSSQLTAERAISMNGQSAVVEETIVLECACSKSRAFWRQFVYFLKVPVAFCIAMLWIAVLVEAPAKDVIGVTAIVLSAGLIVTLFFATPALLVEVAKCLPRRMILRGNRLTIETPSWRETYDISTWSWSIASPMRELSLGAFLPQERSVLLWYGHEKPVVIGLGDEAVERVIATLTAAGIRQRLWNRLWLRGKK